MAELSTEGTERIAITTNRLKLVQVDFADHPAEVRRGYMAEELRRGLASVDPDERDSFLELLRRRFAVGNAAADFQEAERLLAAAPAAAAAAAGAGAGVLPAAGGGPIAGAAGGAAPGGDVTEWETGEEAPELALRICDRLAELLPSLSEGERHALAERLVYAGLGLEYEAPSAWEAEAARAVRAVLEMKPSEEVDLGRVIQAFGLLAQFAGSLYQLTWSTWRAIAPHSAVRRGSNLLKLLARCSSGDPATTAEHLAGDLDRLRQLLASLISAISRVGNQFTAAHLTKFAPSEIEGAVAAESGGGWSLSGAKAARCWKKYVELAEALDANAMEAEIRQVIVDHAEQLMRGLGKSG